MRWEGTPSKLAGEDWRLRQTGASGRSVEEGAAWVAGAGRAKFEAHHISRRPCDTGQLTLALRAAAPPSVGWRRTTNLALRTDRIMALDVLPRNRSETSLTWQYFWGCRGMAEDLRGARSKISTAVSGRALREAASARPAGSSAPGTSGRGPIRVPFLFQTTLLSFDDGREAVCTLVHNAMNLGTSACHEAIPPVRPRLPTFPPPPLLLLQP